MKELSIDDVAQKMRIVLAGIAAGKIHPDPLKLLWAAGVLKDHGELETARACERVARRLLPALSRDLS
jgi:hypothetical protein